MILSMRTALTIGDFSRMTHLSAKALRHYHEIGLLEPATIDPESGYRRYGLEQVRTAQVIRRLRDLGMPLDQIKRVLRAPDLDSRNRAIFQHLRRLEAEMEETSANVASLRRLLEAPERADQQIRLRSLPETPAIAIAERVTMDELEGWWSDAFEQLRAAAESAGLERTGPDGALYPGDLFEEEQADVVAFIPIKRPPERLPGKRVNPYLVPASELAVLVHEGAFRDLDQTYGALGTFVAERAIGLEAPIREYYLVTAFDTPDEAKHRIEIAWPIFQTAVGAEARA